MANKKDKSLQLLTACCPVKVMVKSVRPDECNYHGVFTFPGVDLPFHARQEVISQPLDGDMTLHFWLAISTIERLTIER